MIKSCLYIFLFCSQLFSNNVLWDMGVEIETSPDAKIIIQKEIDLNALQDNPQNIEVKALMSNNFIAPIKKTINSYIWDNIKKRIINENIILPQTIDEKISFIKKKYINQEYYRTLVGIQSLIHDKIDISHDLDLQLIYVESLYKAKKYNVALSFINKYSLDQNSDLGLLIKARIFKNMNNLSEALNAYKKLGEIFPNSDYSYYIKTELKLMERNEN